MAASSFREVYCLNKTKQNTLPFREVCKLSRRKTVSFCLCINKDTTTIFHRNAKFYFQLWPGKLAKEKTPLKQAQHVLRSLLPNSKSDKFPQRVKSTVRGSTSTRKVLVRCKIVFIPIWRNFWGQSFAAMSLKFSTKKLGRALCIH